MKLRERIWKKDWHWKAWTNAMPGCPAYFGPESLETAIEDAMVDSRITRIEKVDAYG